MTDAWGDGPSRRSVLAGGGLLLLAACTGSSEPHAPELSPDQHLARRVADEITLLAAAYAATIAAHPALRTDLAPLAAEHEAHVAALVALLPAPSPTASGSTGSAPPSASPGTSPPPVAASPAAARQSLAAAERAASERRGHQAGRAGRDLARLLASIGACEAVHAGLVVA